VAVAEGGNQTTVSVGVGVTGGGEVSVAKVETVGKHAARRRSADKRGSRRRRLIKE
jgi:hypothetical protein